MRKLFVQFYLLLFVCFLVMAMLVGLVYKFTAERAGRESMNDLMKSSLYLMRSELREIPPRDWNKTIDNLDLNLSFKLHIEPMSKYQLDPNTLRRLRSGEIVALDDEYTFLQHIPRSHYVLAVGLSPTCSSCMKCAFLILRCWHLSASPRLSGIHLDASALARHAETGKCRPAAWAGAS